MRNYLPNGWVAGRREVNRDFLYTLIYNVDRVFFNKVLKEAMELRAKAALKYKHDHVGINLIVPQIEKMLQEPDFHTVGKSNTLLAVSYFQVLSAWASCSTSSQSVRCMKSRRSSLWEHFPKTSNKSGQSKRGNSCSSWNDITMSGKGRTPIIKVMVSEMTPWQVAGMNRYRRFIIIMQAAWSRNES